METSYYVPNDCDIKEFRDAKAIYEEEKETSKRRLLSFSSIEVGIMVEIPAAAVLADHLRKKLTSSVLVQTI